MEYELKPLKNETLKQFLERNEKIKSVKELTQIFINETKKTKNEHTNIYK